MPRRKPPEPETEDENGDVEDDDDTLEDEDSDPEASDEDEPDPDEWVEYHDAPDARPDAPKSNDPPRAREPSARGHRVERRARARADSGMGRPSTGPAVRVEAAAPEVSVSAAETAGTPVDPETELAPDISAWPGTSDAAKAVGRHPSTIKLWRTQGRIRAIQDATGCWRHNPDDLAESLDTPDQTDPGTVLATGMTAIVQQGASANERLLRMTEIATDGLKDATGVLSEELKRAYARIAELEEKLRDAREKLSATHVEDLKHERQMRRLDQRHELTVAGGKEVTARIEGLLTIIGPIAASIGARLLGQEAAAQAIEAKATGAPAAGSPSAVTAAPSPKEDMPFEAKITEAMGRLCFALRSLDGPALQTLRVMMPLHVQQALDDVLHGTSDSAVGKALAVIIKAAQGLSDLQFATFRPIAPADVANVLAELRELLRSEEPGG